MEKCKYCNQTKGHKMSCPTQKIVVTMKQETMEEVSRKEYQDTETAFLRGVKWQAERMYSEEDLRDAFLSFPDEWICFDEWFEQFKNK